MNCRSVRMLCMGRECKNDTEVCMYIANIDNKEEIAAVSQGAAVAAVIMNSLRFFP